MVWLMETSGWPPNCGSSAFQIARFRVREHLHLRGTFKRRTHAPGRDRTQGILQDEEQILERVEEKPDISTRRLAAEISFTVFSESYIKRTKHTML